MNCPRDAEVISARCLLTPARQKFLQACIRGDWHEARSMIEGVLAELATAGLQNRKPIDRLRTLRHHLSVWNC